MLKWIIFILCIIGIYFFFFRKPKTSQKDYREDKKDSIMLECAKCGTYVSSDEAIIQDGKYYCSKECSK